MEGVEAVFSSHVGGPSFTAVYQRAENACLVDGHFGVPSQVFVFPGTLGRFRHEAGGFYRFFFLCPESAN